MIFVGKPYRNKKGVEGVQVVGTKKEFLAAGIEVDGAASHTNKSGEKRLSIRGAPEQMVDIIDAAEEFNRSMEDQDPKTIWEWVEISSANKKAMEMVCELSVEWLPKKPFNPELAIENRRIKKLVVSLMFREGWLDAKGLLTNEGRKTMIEWAELQRTLKKSKRVKKKGPRGG